MAALSDYAETQILTHIFRTGSFTKPANLAIALCTAATTDAHTGATIPEVTNLNAYARAAVAPVDANWSISNGTISNTNSVVFPTATGSWGTITHVAIIDNTAHGQGNVIAHGALTTSKTVSANDTLRFDAGTLTLALA